MDDNTQPVPITRPLTAAEEEQAILAYWRQNTLWRLIGDPNCMHRWYSENPFHLVCEGACGGYLVRVHPPKE